MNEYDAILIGTGQATGTLVAGLVKLGQKVAVIERDRVGGTCVNWGCTPTKTIVASARAAHMVRRAGDFGIEVPEFSINFNRVVERQNAIRNSNSEGLRKYLQEVADFHEGSAAFISDSEVQVGEQTLRGSRIYIHTGARARKPDIVGVGTVPYLDNRGILALEELPEHLIVVGGSYIGLEFSQAFRRFGSRVTVLERSPRIMPREDEDIASEACAILADEGVDIICHTQITALHPGPSGGVAVRFQHDGTERTVSGSHLLLATGRVPNTEDLNLPAAGVETDERGFIQVNDQLQTNVPHIYAVGDVNGRSAFTHTSVHDGQVILRNLNGEDWKASDRIMIYSMFIDPPLGRVGMNEAQARGSGRKVLSATMPMSRIARAREKDETRGLVKFLVDANSKEILGAAILGVGGDEIINGIAAWMYTGLPYTDFQRAVLVHPTVAELMPWVFENLKPLA
ncbi:MAG: mercuric reductase [Spirochaetia bacterium]